MSEFNAAAAERLRLENERLRAIISDTADFFLNLLEKEAGRRESEEAFRRAYRMGNL